MKSNLSMIFRFGLLCSIISIVLFCLHLKAAQPKQTMESSGLSILEKLERSQPLLKSQVEKLLGYTLYKDEKGGNPFFDFFQGDNQNFFISHVSFRVAKNTSRGLLELEINPAKECVAQKEILNRFGQMHNMHVPSPHVQTAMPVYLVYNRSWGTLSFGFVSQGKDCLTSIILESIKKTISPKNK